MAEVIDNDELMGVTEAAEELGVARSNLATVAGLPEPKQRLACGSLWKASDIRELAERRRKAKGDGR